MTSGVIPIESTELVNPRIASSPHSVAGLGPLEYLQIIPVGISFLFRKLFPRWSVVYMKD